MSFLTNANYNVVGRIWVDRHKVRRDDCQIMIVNGKYKRCVDRGVDQAKKVFLALLQVQYVMSE